jgi:hypothetical protein
MTWADVYTYLRGFLELLAFASSVVVAGIGLLVIRQINLAKESLDTAKNDIQVRVDREAVVLAAQLADKFAEKVLPKYAEAIDGLNAESVPLYQWDLLNNSFTSNSLADWDQANAWLRQVRNSEVNNKIVDVLNSYESFSIYFVWGAANDEVVFRSVAAVFL